MLHSLMERLPKRTVSQKVGTSAADLFSAAFTDFCNVIPVPQDRDIGIDFMCELFSGDRPTGKWFHVQCKGKEKLNVSGPETTIQINVTTLNYWNMQPFPVFVVVVDKDKRLFYWTYPKVFLDSLEKDWQNQETVSIKVPVSSALRQDATDIPPGMRAIIDSTVPEASTRIAFNINTVEHLFDNYENPLLRQLAMHSEVIAETLGTAKQAITELTVITQDKQASMVEQLQSQVRSYELLVGKLDYTPEFRAFMVTDSVMTEPFGDKTPEEVIASVKTFLAQFVLDPSPAHYVQLLEAFSSLTELNKDMAWTLKLLDDDRMGL